MHVAHAGCQKTAGQAVAAKIIAVAAAAGCFQLYREAQCFRSACCQLNAFVVLVQLHSRTAFHYIKFNLTVGQLVAKMGGFGSYMLMSSILHAISFGTLSFGAYTAASSILHILIGPVGWAALGIAPWVRIVVASIES